jgi:hypothetical protein
MLKIDNSLLQDVGLAALPDAEKNSFLKHIYETLEMRVGIRLADQMTNQQLDEFEQYFEAKDDAGAFKWLETNFPNYKDIVQEEFDKLKAEVAQSAPQILAASQAQAAAGAGQAPQMPDQPQAPQGYQPTGAPAPAQPYAAPPVPPVPQQYQQQPPAPAPAPQQQPYQDPYQQQYPQPGMQQQPFPPQQPPTGPAQPPQ